MSERAESTSANDPYGPGSDAMSISLRVLRGTMANYAGQFVTLTTGLFLTPFVLSQLGPTHFGLWVLIASVVAYGTVLDFGMWGTVVKYVAEYRARGDLAGAHSLVATALRFYVVLGVIAAGLIVAIAPSIPDLFQIPEADRNTAVWLAVISGLGIGFTIPSVTAFAVLNGLQRFDLANLLTTTATLLAAAATVTILLLGGGVLGVAAVTIPVTIVIQIPTVMVVNRIAPELRFGMRGAKLSEVRTIVSFSSSLFVMQLAGRLQTKSDEIVIGAFLPVSSVTPYALARRLSEMVSLLCEQAAKVIMPLASQLDANRQWEGIRALYVTSSRVTLALSTLAGTVLVMLAGPLLTVWVGSSYADSAYLVTMLTAATLLWVSLLPAGSVLQGSAKHRPLAVASTVSAIANLVLSVILVQSMGVAGVALGTLIPTAVVNLGFVLPYAIRTIGVSFGRIVMDVWVPALLPAVPMALVLYGIQQVVRTETLPAILAAAVTGAIVYVLAYLVVGVRGEEGRVYGTVIRLVLFSIRKGVTRWRSRLA